MAGPDLLETGIYTVGEAAYLVGVTQQRIRGWISGYPRRGAPPIIRNELGSSDGKIAFSFRNLMEMRFVAFFQGWMISFNHIRAIMDDVREITKTPHPFATNIVFRTDGRKIVGEVISNKTNRLIVDLRTKNLEMTPLVYDTLKRDVVFNPRGEATKWYPRRSLAPNVIVHPRFAFGRPILERSRTPTKALADAVKAEGSAAAVADWFDLPVVQVLQAVRFEESLRRVA